jgi:hypothetical protein
LAWDSPPGGGKVPQRRSRNLQEGVRVGRWFGIVPPKGRKHPSGAAGTPNKVQRPGRWFGIVPPKGGKYRSGAAAGVGGLFEFEVVDPGLYLVLNASLISQGTVGNA